MGRDWQGGQGRAGDTRLCRAAVEMGRGGRGMEALVRAGVSGDPLRFVARWSMRLLQVGGGVPAGGAAPTLPIFVR